MITISNSSPNGSTQDGSREPSTAFSQRGLWKHCIEPPKSSPLPDMNSRWNIYEARPASP